MVNKSFPKIYCHWEGILVRENNKENESYETIEWLEEGKQMWEIIKPLNPILLIDTNVHTRENQEQKKK